MLRLSRFTLVAVALCLLCAPLHGQDISLKQALLGNPHGRIAALLKAWELLPQPPRPRDMPPNDQINTCVYEPYFGKSPADDFLINLATIARHRHHLAKDFSEAGYPEQVWRGPLDELVARKIQTIVDRLERRQSLRDIQAMRKADFPYERRLERALNDYRTRHNPRLRRFEASGAGECGGDWIGYVSVRTRPAGGSVRVIKEYYFKLCQVMEIPPYGDRCNSWTPVSPRTSFPQGTYYYLARWPNGDIECDRIELIGGEADVGVDLTREIERTGRLCRQ